MERAREVGVRKVMVAHFHQLVSQFISEGLFNSLSAIVLAVLLILAFIKPFKNVTDIQESLFSVQNLLLWIYFVSIALIGSLLASIYPAFILSSFVPIKVLKGHLFSNRDFDNGLFRKSLIIFQFFPALVLLCVTGAIFYQVEFMKKSINRYR